MQLEAKKDMDRLNGELTKLSDANKVFEKSHKEIQNAQKVLEKRASNSESALKQAQARLKSAEEAATSGQKLLEAVSASLGQLAAPGMLCLQAESVPIHTLSSFTHGGLSLQI